MTTTIGGSTSRPLHQGGRVVVVGSANADIITAVDRRPHGGETVTATATRVHAGGKGANQAAAAARAGASVWFIGAVGSDEPGRAQLDALRDVTVDVTHAITTPHARTGGAFITVTPDGENSIVVSLGANSLLEPDDVLTALDRIPRPAVVLTQTEIPAATVESVAAWCLSNEVRFVLNNGPFRRLSPAALRVADPLVMNEHEAVELVESPIAPANQLADTSHTASGARSVVVTVGEAGAHIRDADRAVHVPGIPVHTVVDTTGAGDVFVGTLAARLAAGDELASATEHATRAAAESVTWAGARPDPTLLELTHAEVD